RDIWGNDHNGKQHNLSDYNGKIILLDFWSPDCPYSSEQHKKELPQLVQKYNPEDFIIISYFIDTEAKDWKKLSEEDYSNWLHISDLQGMKGENISEYDVTGTPNSFLIDKNGIVVKSFIGFYEGEHRIENEINKLMN
ncbi:MAG: TlpA disulfide reductase family protein, partial [Gelidibacter sp.]